MALYCTGWLGGGTAAGRLCPVLSALSPELAQEFCPWVLSAQRPDWLATSFQPSSLPGSLAGKW